MKRLFSLLATTALLGFIAAPADATLIDRGAGLIYDTDLNITWLQDADYARTTGYDADGKMNWWQATTWAAGLSYYDSARNVTYDDWRLPTVVPQNYNYGFDGTTGLGQNITIGSELGHLYYTELGNLGVLDVNGIGPQYHWGLQNAAFYSGGHPGPYTQFHNVYVSQYWSGTEYAPNISLAWMFSFHSGGQGDQGKWAYQYAWAVRDGDVYTPPSAPAPTPTPEPSTLLLLGGGLAGLAIMRKRMSKKQG